MTPLRNYVVLEEIIEEKNAGGIVLTGKEDTKESPRAKVVAKGPEVNETIQVGQTVFYKRHLFEEYYEDVKTEKPLLIGQEEAIIAIL